MLKPQTKFIFFITLALIFVTLIWLSSKVPVKTSQEDLVQTDRPFLGGKEATIVITEYVDFSCPHCRQATEEIKKIQQLFGDQVRLDFRYLPLSNDTFLAAIAAECANQQNKFWPYADILFRKAPAFGSDNLKRYAQDSGLEMTVFNQCLDSQATARVVSADSGQATSRGATSAPAIFINEQNLGSSWQSLNQQILHLIAVQKND